MAGILSVGIGGFIGSVFRYLLSSLPLQGSFPFVTFGINFFGAVLIGAITEISAGALPMPANLLLLLKTGFCGGFTTFSTFSLETVSLVEEGRYGAGAINVCLSVAACMAGVVIGRAFVRLLQHKSIGLAAS